MQVASSGSSGCSSREISHEDLNVVWTEAIQRRRQLSVEDLLEEAQGDLSIARSRALNEWVIDTDLVRRGIYTDSELLALAEHSRIFYIREYALEMLERILHECFHVLEGHDRREIHLLIYLRFFANQIAIRPEGSAQGLFRYITEYTEIELENQAQAEEGKFCHIAKAMQAAIIRARIELGEDGF